MTTQNYKRARLMILGVLAFAMIGTGTELLLLGHDESATQIVPLVLLAVGLAAIAWNAVTESASSIFVMRATMVAFIAGGLLGAILHYQGSVEFQKELDPTIEGLPLFKKVMQSQSPPPLAPGTFAYFGLLGLISTQLVTVRRERT